MYYRSPPWFSGIDSLLEIIIIFTAFMISFYSYNIFSMLKSAKHKYFSVAFFLIGFAYFFRIISSIVLYSFIGTGVKDVFIHTFTIAPEIELFHFACFFLFKLSVTIGFFILFLIATDTLKKSLLIAGSYLILLSITFSSLFGTTIYHSVLIVFLFFICWYYYNNYLKLKSKPSYRILLAFMLIFIAHLIFVIDYAIFYVFGEIILISGFAVLLYNQIELKNKK